MFDGFRPSKKEISPVKSTEKGAEMVVYTHGKVEDELKALQKQIDSFESGIPSEEAQTILKRLDELKNGLALADTRDQTGMYMDWSESLSSTIEGFQEVVTSQRQQ